MTRGAVLAALLAFHGVCAAQPKSDWETRNEAQLWSEESVTALPPYPERQRLIEFGVDPSNDFKFFIDPAALSVGQDGVVRYVLVARSPAGAENVRFEGIRCATGESRLYAVGRPDGSWSARPGEWRAFERGPSRSWQSTLSRSYFCPLRAAIGSPEEGIQALRDGGHPAVRVEHR